MDPNLMKVIAIESIKRYASAEISKILIIEALGIVPAVITGLLLDLPVVSAKKKKPSTMNNILSIIAFLSTKQRGYNVVTSEDHLTPNDKVVLIDDFLAHGNVTRDTVDLRWQVDVELVRTGFIIEKTPQHRCDGIGAEDVRREPLAIIESLDNC